ncbi:1083_t:CDS:2 [Ambispora leptoticha]|uniref:1083_t:CDS:1 n=1 Tax=Ambispora leptoticha TaxID=144679 RepID=A0A9N9FLA2_9GLOM|nr:1083_t:CDS:2 [Ambispora leptoticha]
MSLSRLDSLPKSEPQLTKTNNKRITKRNNHSRYNFDSLPSISKCPIDDNDSANADDQFLLRETSDPKFSQKPLCDRCDVSKERVKTLNESFGKIEAIMDALAKTTTGAESLKNHAAMHEGYYPDKSDEEEQSKNFNQDFSNCSFEDLKNLANLAYNKCAEDLLALDSQHIIPIVSEAGLQKHSLEHTESTCRNIISNEKNAGQMMDLRTFAIPVQQPIFLSQ